MAASARRTGLLLYCHLNLTGRKYPVRYSSGNISEAGSEKTEKRAALEEELEARREGGGEDADKTSSREEGGERDVFQLDAGLKKLKWTMQFIETNRALPDHLLHTLVTELVVQETFLLLDLGPDAALNAEAWVMDLSMRELPNGHSFNSLEKEDTFIINQELYYRKTKPPKLGGGTMDTRRSSPDDSVFKASLLYTKGDVKGTRGHFYL